MRVGMCSRLPKLAPLLDISVCSLTLQLSWSFSVLLLQRQVKPLHSLVLLLLPLHQSWWLCSHRARPASRLIRGKKGFWCFAEWIVCWLGWPESPRGGTVIRSDKRKAAGTNSLIAVGWILLSIMMLNSYHDQGLKYIGVPTDTWHLNMTFFFSFVLWTSSKTVISSVAVIFSLTN